MAHLHEMRGASRQFVRYLYNMTNAIDRQRLHTDLWPAHIFLHDDIAVAGILTTVCIGIGYRIFVFKIINQIIGAVVIIFSLIILFGTTTSLYRFF